MDLGLFLVLLAPAAACRTRAETPASDPSYAAFQRGDYARAVELARNPSAARSALLRGLAARSRGDRATASVEFQKLCGAAEAGRLRGAADLADAAEACRHLGRIHEANRAFKQAAEAAPASADIRARWGRLFLAAHNAAEAERLFEEAVKLDAGHPDALTGAAEALSDRWDAGAEKHLARALERDPEFVPAYLILARLALEEEKTDKAEEHVRRARALQPKSGQAIAFAAAVAWQRGRKEEVEQLLAEALKLNPTDGEIFEPLAHVSGMARQFSTSAEFCKRGVALDPSLWNLHSELGVALFRLGRDDDARAALEIAFKGDPFDVRTVNTLRLMDSFSRFERFETEHFRAKLHQKEAAALRPYVEELLERSITTLAQRYRFKLRDKVSFEMFPDHEDFAVRTLGLPGLGALGASFGAVVAMDSPAARPAGSFHWGSTLWHEVAHVVTLQATGNRIPRWFTEGLSVYEEHRAGWGDRMDFQTVNALKQGKLMPIAQLNAGFVRPRYPGQVQFAYFQAGMLCRFIAEKHGFDKILSLITAFAAGEQSEPALERVLGRKLEALDTEFKDWLEQQTAPLVKAVDIEWRQPRPRADLEAEVARRPENFFARLHLARALRDEKKPAEALAHAEAARDLFPAAVDSGNPYEIAAEIHLAAGHKDKAAGELRRWLRAGGMNPATVSKLAALLVELGRRKEAIEALESQIFVAPLDAALHQSLGDEYLAAARHAEAVKEFNAVLALKPVDPAQAHFNLARAYAASSRPADARREVLAALEIAPGFSAAQKLLLELVQ